MQLHPWVYVGINSCLFLVWVEYNSLLPQKIVCVYSNLILWKCSIYQWGCEAMYPYLLKPYKVRKRKPKEYIFIVPKRQGLRILKQVIGWVDGKRGNVCFPYVETIPWYYFTIWLVWFSGCNHSYSGQNQSY